MANQGKAAARDRLVQIEQQADLQPLPPDRAQVPDNVLQNLGRQRAEIIQNYLVNTLGITPDRIEIQDIGSSGTKVDILLRSLW